MAGDHQLGNSSGKANDYKLTYPKGDMDVTIPLAKGVTGDTLPLRKGVVFDTQRVTSMTGKGVMDDTPSSPTTSPGTSPKRSSPGADPFGGSGDYLPATETTTELKGVTDVTLPRMPWDEVPQFDVPPAKPKPKDRPVPVGVDPFA